MKAMHKTHWGVACVVLLFCVSIAHGAILNIPMTVQYSGTAPAGPVTPHPWVRAYLDDSAQNGTLKLWLENLGLTDDEFLSKAYLNLKSDYDVTQLEFTDFHMDTGTFDAPSINLGQDTFTAGGGGKHDIELIFSTSNANQGAKRFGAGERLSYTLAIYGVNLPLEAFFEMSSPHGGHGPFVAAGHVQGIGGDDEASGWISHDGEGTPGYPEIVPEPATLALLFGSSLAVLRRRRS